MVQPLICEVCGNAIEPGAAQCPYCKAEQGQAGPSGGTIDHRIVNLEKGMPLVAQALERLNLELETARRQGVRVVTLIHGYGSSGRGGAIKLEVQRHLGYLCHRKVINDMIPGEDFNKGSGRGRQLLRRFPFLTAHRDLNRSNHGITLVIL